MPSRSPSHTFIGISSVRGRIYSRLSSADSMTNIRCIRHFTCDRPHRRSASRSPVGHATPKPRSPAKLRSMPIGRRMRRAFVTRSRSKICRRLTRPSREQRPDVIRPPAGAQPRCPPGFKIEQFADRLSRSALSAHRAQRRHFVTESRADRIKVLRDTDGDGKPDLNELFADTA